MKIMPLENQRVNINTPVLARGSGQDQIQLKLCISLRLIDSYRIKKISWVLKIEPLYMTKRI